MFIEHVYDKKGKYRQICMLLPSSGEQQNKYEMQLCTSRTAEENSLPRFLQMAYMSFFMYNKYIVCVHLRVSLHSFAVPGDIYPTLKHYSQAIVQLISKWAHLLKTTNTRARAFCLIYIFVFYKNECNIFVLFWLFMILN